jgi:hypothetical protein
MFNGDGTIKPPGARRCDANGVCEMHFFNNNLIRPSAQAGIHAQLVEYDMTKDDGVVAGGNRQSTVAGPRAQHTYRYYAGHIDMVELGTSTSGKGKKQTTTRDFRRRATPVEFGGSNLLSADRVKQPQKGLYGALVIEPKDACHEDAPSETCTPDPLRLVADGQGSLNDTRPTRAQATIDASAAATYTSEYELMSGGVYDEAISIAYRIANLRWSDGTAVTNIHQGELGREGAEDSGHAGYNYAAEPSWFRFGLAPDVPFGNAVDPFPTFGNIPNVHAFYANALTLDQPPLAPASANPDTNFVPYMAGISAEGDPATPVFRMRPGEPGRIHVLNGASADRDATFILHGHVWQRDPFVCPNDNYLGIKGFCEYWNTPAQYDNEGVLVPGTGQESGPSTLGSLALGLNPIGKYMGGEEGMGHVYGHWPILFRAGGSKFTVEGDYLYRDYAPSGGRNGMFGLIRVGNPAPPPETPPQGGTAGGGGGN